MIQNGRLLCLLLLLSCNAQKPTATNPEQTLRGIEWRLTKMHDTDYQSLRPPITLTISETEDRVTGFSGCNRYFGSIDIRSTQVQFGQLGSTKMYCEDKSKIEDEFLLALQPIDAYRIEHSTLLFLKEDSIVMEFVK